MATRYVTFVGGVIWNITNNKNKAAKFERNVLHKFPKYQGQIETVLYE